MSHTSLYLDKSTLNEFYLSIYTLTLECLFKFSCPIVFDMYKKENIKIRLVCNKCLRIDMVLRYLTLELDSLKRVSNIDFEYSIDTAVLPITPYSLSELENANRFLSKVKQHDIKSYKKPIYN